MKIRPVFYLRNWQKATLEQLKSLAALNIPVIVMAQELQKSSSSLEFMSCFQKGQLQLISADVDDQKSDLHWVINQAIVEEWTHIIAVSEWGSGLLEKIFEFSKLITKDPFHFIFFLNLDSTKEKTSSFINRLLNLDGLDYRTLKTDSIILPVFHIQRLKLSREDGLDFNRCLLHCIKNRYDYNPIYVSDIKNSAIKKSDKLLQSRIIDWWLLALSSLHSSSSPLHSSISFGVGAFLACTPFYGLQTGLIVLFCFVFRLSFPIAFLGSQISIPPIYSLIVPVQIYVGFILTGKEFRFEGPWLEIARDHFSAWMIGSLVVGGILSLSMAVIWYKFQVQSKRKKVNWTGKMRGGRWGNSLMIFLLRIFGLKFSYFLLYFIVPYFYLFAPTARRGINEYYQVTKKELGFWQRQEEVIRHLYCFAQILVDQGFQAHDEGFSFDIQYVTGNALKEHQSEGAKLMMFSHFGGWAISTQGFSRRKSIKPMNLIRYQTDSLTSSQVFKDKNIKNLKPIDIKPGEPVFMAIHEVLRGEGHLAIMGDRPFDNNFELRNFLNQLAPIPTTPFRLAKTYNAKLNFVLGFRMGFKSYGLATKSIDLSETEIDEAIEQYLAFLVEYVTKYPKQWFNLYNYWSSLPTLPNGDRCVPVRNELVLCQFPKF